MLNSKMPGRGRGGRRITAQYYDVVCSCGVVEFSGKHSTTCIAIHIIILFKKVDCGGLL